MTFSKLAPLKDYNLILGSQSPRRKELLAQLELDFTQKVRPIEEHFPNNLSLDLVAEYLSKEKSKAFENDLGLNDLVITSDTVVILNDQILGKAKNAEEAKKMLHQLSGQKHEVISGVTLLKKNKSESFSVKTSVFMKPLSEEEIDYYISNYQPFDKAGAYGIQEWIGFIGVEKIEGSYYNVMGLPLKELFEALNEFVE